MEHLRVFLDHLYFSIICVGVGLIVLYVILSGIGAESAISNHLLFTGIICGVSVLRVGLFFHKSDYQEQSSAAHYPHATTILNSSRIKGWLRTARTCPKITQRTNKTRPPH